MPERYEPKPSEAVGMALTRFLEEDLKLIEYRVKEEALSHRLGCYLQELFPGYSVDCEYDKYGESVKKEAYGSGIRPDIIVHERGTQDNNIFVVEIKKRNRPSAWDVKKLKRLTSSRGRKYRYNYRLDAFIGFSPNDSEITLEWFERGKHVPLTSELVG